MPFDRMKVCIFCFIGIDNKLRVLQPDLGVKKKKTSIPTLHIFIGFESSLHTTNETSW